MGDTPRTDAAIASVKHWADVPAVVAEESRTLERELAAARAWNERVSVCAKHTADIVDGECVICALEAAQARVAELEKERNELQSAFEDAVTAESRLAAAEAQPVAEAKPTAWMIWAPMSGPAQFTTDPKAPIWGASRADYVVTPLYAQPQPVPDGWISVDERLPQEGKWVLAYNGAWRGVARFFAHREKFERWEDEATNYIETFAQKVTHWQPLPGAPK